MKTRIKFAAAALALALLSLGAAPALAQTSMYESLGGKASIAKVVDDFVGIVAADTRINFQFGKTDIPRLKTMLNDQLSGALGGPCTYTGRDMTAAHAGMGVTNAQFNAIAEDLYVALEKNGVPYRTQNQIMAMLAQMQRQIVTK